MLTGSLCGIALEENVMVDSSLGITAVAGMLTGTNRVSLSLVLDDTTALVVTVISDDRVSA